METLLKKTIRLVSLKKPTDQSETIEQYRQSFVQIEKCVNGYPKLQSELGEIRLYNR